jgi:peptidyl-tRNA hydrolase
MKMAHTKKEVSVIEDKSMSMEEKIQFLDDSRIYVILAAKVKKADGSYHVMEPGRMMAQVGHAVSRLKIFDALDRAGANSGNDPNNQQLWQWLNAYLKTGVTVINLYARDEKELYHIASLADTAGLRWVDFRDDNDDIYGKGMFPTTAVAIGPTTKEQIIGICDYIPLYK